MGVGIQHHDKVRAPLVGDSFEIDESHRKIDCSHNNKTFKVVVDEYMYLVRGENDEITLESVTEQLEKIDRFKSYFLIALAKLMTYRVERQRNFDTQYAQFSQEMESSIVEERMKDKIEKKVPMSMFQGITKENIRNKVLQHPAYSSQYATLETEMASIDEKITLIEGFRKDLYERSSNLRKLADKLGEDKKMDKYNRVQE